MKHPFLKLFLLISFLTCAQSYAQKNQVFKLGVFAPIYFDSAFAGNEYKLGNSISKSNIQGLEFYNGMMLALDSLNEEGIQAEVYFYDTKNSSEPLNQILEQPTLQSLSLIIASFNNRAEMKPLADFALKNKIPLISETYPNDGGIVGNPYFVLINPTLKTHMDAIYKYLQRSYATSNIVWVKKNGQMEDLIQSYFLENNKKTPALPLKFKTVELVDSFNTIDILNKMDSNRQNIVICGSLQESFGMSVVKALSSSINYTSIIIGMPNWDGFKDLFKPEYKNIDVIYTTAYNFNRNEKLGQNLVTKYRNKFIARPTDLVFKGYESVHRFSKLAIKYKSNLIHGFWDKSFKLFNDFDIQAIRFNKETKEPDYWENKKLYFMKKADGQFKLLF